jgi:plasmid replication initiation protein
MRGRSNIGLWKLAKKHNIRYLRLINTFRFVSARSKSKVRRLLEQFSIQSNDPELPTITVAAEEDAKRPSSLQTSNTSQQSSPTTSYSSSSSAPYVTTIVIRQSD